MRDTLWCGVIQRQCDGTRCKNCHLFPRNNDVITLAPDRIDPPCPGCPYNGECERCDYDLYTPDFLIYVNKENSEVKQ